MYEIIKLSQLYLINNVMKVWHVDWKINKIRTGITAKAKLKDADN